jgi:two-component system sensor histidine kinase UhpB
MKTAPLQLLLVEDEPDFAQLLKELLQVGAAPHYAITHASTLASALAELTRRTPDLILLDLSLPDQRGKNTYYTIHAAAPQVPVIVLSGSCDEDLALQTVRAGAQDYLMKSEFDVRVLHRAIRHACERKAIELRLRESEEFFRLISENVTDLISVVDAQGRRLYTSPSYQAVLGPGEELTGTNSFAEIHPEDRPHIQTVFQEVLRTGAGRRAEYRFLRPDGTVRHVESQSNVIHSPDGQPHKVVVVSRDVTERIQTECDLRHAIEELQHSHEQLKTAQRQLVQSEKLEAISTFAAGVAHEVKNPLQTVVLGIDYLRDYVVTNDAAASDLLQQMSEAVQRADAIVRGLVEFAAFRKGPVTDQNLSEIFRHALRTVEGELASQAIQLHADLAEPLPALRLDQRAMKHVIINLLATELQTCATGGALAVKTYTRPAPVTTPPSPAPATVVVVAEVESRRAPGSPPRPDPGSKPGNASRPDKSEFGLLVSRKIIELYGGRLDCARHATGSKYTIAFNS